MPTFFGPTNIPPLEAFALGCPLLTSNIYAIPEQVGDAGLLFDPHNVLDISKKIKSIWEDRTLRNKLIVSGYKRDKYYSQQNLNIILLKIINSLI